MARNILSDLKLPIKLIDTVTEIIKKHMILYRDVTDKKFNKLLSEMGYDNLLRLIEHSIADNESKNNEVVSTENDFHERLKRAVEKQMQVTVNDLAINGKDLIELDFSGAEIGQIRKELLDKYLSEEIKNENKKYALCCYVCSYCCSFRINATNSFTFYSCTYNFTNYGSYVSRKFFR